jgi:rubrerythrin
MAERNMKMRFKCQCFVCLFLLVGQMIVSLPALGQTNLPQVGSTTNEVLAILGEPKGRMKVGQSVVWIYEHGTVEFQRGKVTILDPRIVKEQEEKTRLARIKEAGATLDNMIADHDSEYTANARYRAFAAKADEDGFKSVAALFRAAAKSEGIRADHQGITINKIGAFDRCCGSGSTYLPFDVKTTRENLETAMKAGVAARITIYPAFIKQAEIDKNDGEVMIFKNALASEAGLVSLYEKALAELNSWKPAGKDFLVCQTCGYVTAFNPQLQKCPDCAAPLGKNDIVK